MTRHRLANATPALLFAIGVLGLAAAPALAEQSAASAAAKGKVRPLLVEVAGAAPAAPAKVLAAKTGALVERVLATPTLHNPHGFSLTRSVKVDPPPPGLSPDHPLIAEVIMIAQEINLEAGAKPDAGGAYMGRLEGPTFRIGVNDMTRLYANVTWADDYANATQYLPLQKATAQGFPVFRVGVRDVVLITKPGRKPWVHVSQGEFLTKLIAESRAQQAAYPSPKGQAALDRQAAALAALTPQQRAAPACVSARLSLPLGDCGEANATYYVRLNAGYFDKGLPKGAVQLVTISTPAEGGHGHKRLEPKFRAAAAELDYRAIQAALD